MYCRGEGFEFKIEITVDPKVDPIFWDQDVTAIAPVLLSGQTILKHPQFPAIPGPLKCMSEPDTGI
jgi:hypothetical protein